MTTIRDAYGIAFELQQAGKLEEAESTFRRILEADRNQPIAWFCIGVIASQQGKIETSISCFVTATTLDPNFAEAHNNLGVLFSQQGRLDKASESYQRVLSLKPDFAEAHLNLATVLERQGFAQQAVTHCQRSLQLKPGYLEALNGLGNLLKNLKRPDEAVDIFQHLVELYPQLAEGHNNLGTALQDQGNLSEAIHCYQSALRLKPDYAPAYTNWGTAAKLLGQLNVAIDCYYRAIELCPSLAAAHAGLGSVYEEQGKLDEAQACLEQALHLEPNDSAAHNNLGNVFKHQKDLDKAVACYQRALELNPENAEAHANLGGLLKDQARLDEAIASYRKALALRPHFVSAHSSLLYAMIFSPRYDAKAIYDEHVRWNELHAKPLAHLIKPHHNDRSPHRRLRLGYLSGDFRNHVQQFFTLSLFQSHNREQFEVICYSNLAVPDNITERYRVLADEWCEIFGRSDEDAAQVIRNDQIDILIDLNMHMAGGRPLVLARRPAPVQVCWFAYPGTTGMTAVDYRLTDPYLDPPELGDHYYSENSIRLADTFWCYDPQSDEPAVNQLPALTNGYVTFGSLNNFCKLNDSVLLLWSQVLKAVSKSRLLLLAPQGGHRQRTIDFFEKQGVATHRVEFVSFQPRDEYLRLYHRIDVGLDPFPYNGHVTSLDALWMGVPVVTMRGDTVVGRAGTSQLTNLGLIELIAQSPQDFVTIAAQLAADLPRLNHLRQTLRQRMLASPLTDAQRFARSMEAAYRQIWRKWCNRDES